MAICKQVLTVLLIVALTDVGMAIHAHTKNEESSCSENTDTPLGELCSVKDQSEIDSSFLTTTDREIPPIRPADVSEPECNGRAKQGGKCLDIILENGK